MSQYTAELEELQAVLATQELLAIESVDISECLGDGFDKNARFQKPTTLNEIEQREGAWAEYRNTQIETLGDEYRSVPVDLGDTYEAQYTFRMFCYEERTFNRKDKVLSFILPQILVKTPVKTPGN